MKRYAIANYLTRAQKQRAIEADYGLRGRDPQGCCPLGAALAQPGYPVPMSIDVANLLRLRESAWWRAAEVAAWEFIDAWDRGRIPADQLAAALGVEP